MFNKGITHGGTFHADDVFSTILLKKLNTEIQISRVFKAPETVPEDTIVFDIGEGEYDHHQKGKALREDGTPYAAFGLLWRAFGHVLCYDNDAFAKFDRDFVRPVDLCDNGVEYSTLSAAVSAMNPNWDEDITPDEAFELAVAQMTPIFEAELRRVNSASKARAEVAQAARRVKNHVMVLDRYVPWQDEVIENQPDVLFVVFPSNRGGYNIQTVPDAPGSFTGRKGFPSAWLGNPNRDLGMTFCHVNNFLACADTLEHAVNIANIAVEA